MGNPNAFAQFTPESEGEFAFEYEGFEFKGPDWAGEAEVFDEAELMELAGELLAIDSDG